MRTDLSGLGPISMGLLLGIGAPTAGFGLAPVVNETILSCEQGIMCQAKVEEFLAKTDPGTARDDQILEIVLTLAETANIPAVPLTICLEAAKGLVALSAGLTDPFLRDQVLSIAEAMCLRNTTASLGDGQDGGGDGTNPGGHGNVFGFNNPGQGRGHDRVVSTAVQVGP